ncbi:anthranilate synthase component I family protein [Reinekea sp.]|uniref:anthranilate synthase component I family protein n=1 Tax=Reinekea sp. TaxID=1970455 RepID=UPI002A807492|nr:anthranilate synthase component I family protein [Reinekea sp.]
MQLGLPRLPAPQLTLSICSTKDFLLRLIPIPYSPDDRFGIDLLEHQPGLIWFHGGAQSGDSEWFSAWPTLEFQYLGQQQIRITDHTGHRRDSTGDFFACLKAHCPPIEGHQSVVFGGGLAGHLTYDFGLELHKVPSQFPPLTAPLAVVGQYDWSISIDHAHQQAFLVLQDYCPPEIAARARALVEQLKTRPPSAAPVIVAPTQPANRPSPWVCDMSAQGYRTAFARIQDYIVSGDIYQANLTRQWSRGDAGLSDWAIYQHIIDAMPAPFSVFHRHSTSSLLSVSPERFIQIRRGKMQAQPIKGTRPRGRDAEQDEVYRQELIHSAKDRAENLMIVDLLRNDLARHAKPGSVQVTGLFEIQSFKNVHHLVSTIVADLKERAHPLDVLRDAFPGGSITGAPKKRAMEVIDELESTRRGHYCGCSFFLASDGYLDSNILIRSVSLERDTLTCSGGGGIVYDSDCAAEYAESELKVHTIMATLGI